MTSTNETAALRERTRSTSRRGSAATRPPRTTRSHSVKASEVMEFSRQLGAFLEAGIPIIEGLEIVRNQVESAAMGHVLDEILADLRRGTSFTDAIAKHKKVFPAYYRAIVHSADYTGRLDQVLTQLTAYLERDINARRQLRSALTYPILVLCVATVAIAAMSLFVLPKFAGLYRSLGAKLPLPTRMLLGFTDFVSAYWWAILLVAIAIVAVAAVIFGGDRGKGMRDRLLMRLPVIGELVHLVAVERFARVLAALSTAGVPLPDGIVVAADSTNNTIFQDKLATVRETLVRGGGLSDPMEEADIFPLPALQMVKVGERTGMLGAQLAKTATYYEREVTFRLKKATDLFQPIVILGVGIVVGFVAIAQVAAMYSVFSQVK